MEVYGKNNYRSGPTGQLLLKENLSRYHAFTLFKKSTGTCPDPEGKIGTLVTKKTLSVPHDEIFMIHA